MAKKDKNKDIIVEKEPIVVDEKAIISGEELSNDEVIDVESPKVIIENNAHDDEKVERKLICRQSFTDKFNNEIVYKIGDELNITDVVRRNDLIQRGLAVEE